MDEIEHILDTFLRRSGKNVRFPHGIVYAHRDWLIVLALFAFVVVVLLSLSAWLFFGVSRDIASSGVGDAPIPTINRGELSEVLEELQARQRKLNELRGTKPSIGNP